jgi:hypothetical protein
MGASAIADRAGGPLGPSPTVSAVPALIPSAVYVTSHAIDRYIERVEAVSRETALERILSAERAIVKAAEIGCACVKINKNIRFALDGRRVVSVYGAGMFPRSARAGGA